MKRSAHRIAVVLFALFASSSFAEIRFDWSQEEIDCAASIGIELRHPTIAAKPSFIKHLTWLADIIVIANVTAIDYDRGGPYPTIVILEASSFLKGSIGGDSFTVMLDSGPSFGSDCTTHTESIAHGEPEFGVGEKVLLFLHKGYDRQSTDDQYRALDHDEYRLVDDSKILLDQKSGTQVDHTATKHSMIDMLADIRLAIEKQQTLCVE